MRLLCVALLTLSTGCSLLGTQRVSDRFDVTKAEPDCPPVSGAPLLDAGIATGLLALGAIWLISPQSSMSGVERAIAAGTGGLFFGGSAIYGLANQRSCDDAWERRRQWTWDQEEPRRRETLAGTDRAFEAYRRGRSAEFQQALKDGRLLPGMNREDLIRIRDHRRLRSALTGTPDIGIELIGERVEGDRITHELYRWCAPSEHCATSFEIILEGDTVVEVRSVARRPGRGRG